MEVRNKHQQKTAATRAKLLAAARRVFAQAGFAAARIEDIAAEAGHTRGAFYAHFETKEDLFFALLERQAAERLDSLRRDLAKNGTPAERLQTLRNFYVTRASNRQSVMLTLEFKLFALRHPKMRARLAAAHRRIRASLKYESLAKLLPPRSRAEDTEPDKVILEVVLSGLVLEQAYDPKRLSSQQMTALLGSIFDFVTARG